MRCFKLHQLKRWNAETMRCSFWVFTAGWHRQRGNIYEVLGALINCQFCNSPLFEHPEGCWLNTVCWPGRVASLITNGNRKPSKICSDQVNHRPLLAFYVQSRALTPVLGPPIRTWDESIYFSNLFKQDQNYFDKNIALWFASEWTFRIT